MSHYETSRKRCEMLYVKHYCRGGADADQTSENHTPLTASCQRSVLSYLRRDYWMWGPTRTVSTGRGGRPCWSLLLYQRVLMSYVNSYYKKGPKSTGRMRKVLHHSMLPYTEVDWVSYGFC